MNQDLLDQARSVARMTGTRLRLRIPSVLASGEEFALDMSVVGSDSLPCDTFTNTIRFADSQGIEGLPATLRFDSGTSILRVEGLKAIGSEVAVVRGIVEGTDKIDGDPNVASNPAWVQDDPAYRIYWGDIHVHTRISNCSGWRCLDPEWCYQYARDMSLLDFAAPADHLRGIAADPANWPRLQQLARDYNDPHRFVSLLAFESSHAQGYGGDNNIYYLDDEAPHFWLDREDMKGIAPKVPLPDMWDQLDANGKEYISIPHHTGRPNKYRSWDEDYYSPEHEPLFEIYSSWGSSEARQTRFPMSGGNNDAASYYTDALKAGTRFGVIASSDDHATLPGAVHTHRIQPYDMPNLCDQSHNGLAAIRATELTRPALFDAMKRRSTYATTLARSLVDVQIGDASMGEEIKADAVLSRKREIRVRLTLHGSPGAKISLMRNGELLESKSLGKEFPVSSAVNEVVFEDAERLEDIAVKDAKFHPDPFAVYYVRIEDGRSFHQWTSPIWVDV
jgi:hypothetical protein